MLGLQEDDENNVDGENSGEDEDGIDSANNNVGQYRSPKSNESAGGNYRSPPVHGDSGLPPKDAGSAKQLVTPATKTGAAKSTADPSTGDSSSLHICPYFFFIK